MNEKNVRFCTFRRRHLPNSTTCMYDIVNTTPVFALLMKLTTCKIQLKCLKHVQGEEHAG